MFLPAWNGRDHGFQDGLLFALKNREGDWRACLVMSIIRRALRDRAMPRFLSTSVCCHIMADTSPDVLGYRLAPSRMKAAHDYATAEDEDLIAWSAEGDRCAFGAIVDRHSLRALRIAQRILQDRAAAEDVAQEALVRVWQHAERFDRGRARFSTWLFRIVVNLAIDQKRRKIPEPLDDRAEFVDPSARPDEILAQNQRRIRTRAAMAELPDRQRAAVVLTYQEGLAGTEAAKAMGVTTKALERLLSRARAFLRHRLADIV